MSVHLDAHALERALSVRDLTDPDQGHHAMQELVAAITTALRDAWGAALVVERAGPIVTVADNYDALCYPPGGAARDARYTRYVDDAHVLRTQTTAMIPPLLRRLAGAMPADVLLACPGLVYRRDTIDRLHTGEPHQMDLWRIRRGPLGAAALAEMIGLVVEAALPGARHRTIDARHPYTLDGLEIDVETPRGWVEIGECGLALPALLGACGLDPSPWSGLAMGLGLDRLLMLRKGIDDIRLLRSNDPRVTVQLRGLEPYRPVSREPPIRRDLSIAVAADTSPEELGDRVRRALGPRSDAVESVDVVAEHAYETLPPAAIARMGVAPGQKNVLLRVVLRDLERTLTDPEANVLRDEIYAALHEGSAHEWAAR